MDWSAFISEWREVALAAGFKVEVMIEKDGYEVLACSKGEGLCVYLSSGVHGDEPAGPHALMELLKEGFFGEGFRWLICPVLNPVGLEKGTRENGDGVDLNRDYLRKETLEVQAHVGWLEREETPRMFLSLHEDWESSGIYYYEINTGTRGPEYKEILSSAAEFFKPEPENWIDGHEVTRAGWIYHADEPDIPEGWPEAIYLAKQGCGLSLTFETPSRMELDLRVGCHAALVRTAVGAFEL